MKKIVTVILSVLLCIILVACTNGKHLSLGEQANSDTLDEDAPVTEKGSSTCEFSETPNADNIIDEIVNADRIDIEEIYDKLSNVKLIGTQSDFQKKIDLLYNCTGRFVQQSENSGNKYTADVSFYLSKGDIYCSIDYSGYMGEIADGIVQGSSKDGYFFESFPKGDLYGREQDFKIYFSNESLYISWADTCEYTLTRGDGSVENAQERNETFEETGVLDTIEDLIDKDFSGFEHNVVYDKETSSISISLQMDGLRSALTINDSQIVDEWEETTDLFSALSEQLYNAAKIPTYREDGIFIPYIFDVHIFIVDKINPNASYSESEMLLWVDNGAVKYNVIDNNFSSQNTNHPITTGERNALKSAQNYLSVMAFSYRGLVEQLEYEGYTTSEAEYAADNCGADWNQQAVKKAKEYLAVMSFSRDGLIEQLEYEGFTHSQATLWR